MSAQLDLGPRRDPALDDPVVDFLPEPTSASVEARLYRGVLRLAQVLLLAGVVVVIAIGFLAWGLVAMLALVIFGLAQDPGPDKSRD